MKMQKQAQGGMNAAILVAIIAGLIILYIIFLPSSEKEKFLENRTSSQIDGGEASVLLKAFPGLLSASGGLGDEKAIPNIFLVETTNANELEKINPFIVRSGWFDKRERKIDFALDDPDNLDNVVLSFTAKKRKGILTIKLNGVNIFEGELANEIAEPVSLSPNLLGKKNTLEFGVSSVGARFWATNEYSFENVKIIGDITDTSRQESANAFTISNSEFSSLEEATLKFVPYCSNVNELGTLNIFVNNKKIFSTVPTCDNAYKQSIPRSVLNEGENNIVFKTSKGTYSIEQIRVALKFKEPTVKTYFFEIDGSTFRKIRDNERDIILSVKFIDDKKQKRLKLDVNGRIETIETEKASFTKNINSKAVEGNNYARLEPFDDIEIVELKVELA